MSQTCQRCQRIVHRACQNETEMADCRHLKRDVPRSWKPEVMVMGETKWAGNGLRFATQVEAERSAMDLHARWTLVTATRAAESEDPVNYRWDPELGLVAVNV